MSSRKIEDLHQIFQPMVRSLIEQGQQAIASTGWTFFITDGFRSFIEQTELYARGRTKPGKIVTNALAGQSPHNYGLAVDCAFQKSGNLSYDPTLYAKIYPIARTLGFELGADWVGFTDKPHFEHPQWEKISKGETDMQMYKGYDLDNKDSMKVAVDILVRVQTGEFVEKKLLDEAKKANEELANKLADCQSKPVIDTEFTVTGKKTTETIGGKTVEISYKAKV